MTKKARILITMDKALLAKLEKLSQAQRRSRNKQIVFIVEDYLDYLRQRGEI